MNTYKPNDIVKIRNTDAYNHQFTGRIGYIINKDSKSSYYRVSIPNNKIEKDYRSVFYFREYEMSLVSKAVTKNVIEITDLCQI